MCHGDTNLQSLKSLWVFLVFDSQATIIGRKHKQTKKKNSASELESTQLFGVSFVFFQEWNDLKFLSSFSAFKRIQKWRKLLSLFFCWHFRWHHARTTTATARPPTRSCRRLLFGPTRIFWSLSPFLTSEFKIVRVFSISI